MMLAEILNLKIILGALPESIGLLVFGVGLIGFTVIVRRVLNWAETSGENQVKH